MDSANRQERGINAVVGAQATNVVEIRATGVVELCTTSMATGTRTRPNYTAHRWWRHSRSLNQHRDEASQAQVEAECATLPLAGDSLARSP